MTKVLLTGGSGFIAAHILELLLAQGHAVVTTVRTEAKAARIREAHADLGPDHLQIALTPDLTRADAFDEVVQTPGIEVVLHTASPFTYKITDPIKDLVDPAVLGTTNVLKAIKKYAPQVRRVVVTSSLAAILDDKVLLDDATLFTEQSWNPATLEDVKGDSFQGYRVSKTLAERAAWDFVENEKPNFDLVTVNPPTVFGPVVHHLEGLAAINTSNERIANAITGVWKADGKVPDTGVALIWVDVRDVAAAHVAAGLERPDAAGRRLFTVGGYLSNRAVFDILRKNFPEYAGVLPPADAPGGEAPPKHYKYDNTATTEFLGITWTPLEKSIVDTVKSLQSYVQ